MYDEEYFCPNCGAILNDQYGFDPDCDSWTCISCGKTLYGEGVYEGERYEGVMWYCDSCGALLNKQLGFHDYCDTWTCTECWHSNRISDDEIYESGNEYQESQRDRLDENNDDYDYDGETMYCDHCGEMLNKQDDFDEFLEEIDLVVIMVKHDEIKENMGKLSGKIVLDCHNICDLPGVYHI